MKQIFPRLLLSSYFLLQLVKSCDEIIQCEHTDPECLVQLRLFQTCVSSRCDSQNIESQNIEELSKCYSETCISKYEPINLSIQKYTNCMVKRIKKNSLHFNLPTLQTIFDPIIYSKCKRGLADSCIFLSSECAWQLSEQFECEKRCLPFEHYKMVEFCLSSICKPDLLGLQALNKQYVECLSQETQVQTSSSPSQPIAKSDIKSCDEIIQCEPNDHECLVQLSLFQTCVSSRCDSYNIESQNAQELSKCYSETCISKYEPFNLLLQKYSNCMIERILKKDLHLNLPTLQTIIDPNLFQKCRQRLADQCVLLSPECPQQLIKEFECAQSCLPPDHYKMIEFCLTRVCKPELVGLQILNQDYVECLSSQYQGQTNPQPSQQVIRSTSEMLIVSLLLLIISTIMY